MIYKQLHKIILKVFLIFLHLNLSILITSCVKIEREPKVITEAVSEITTYSAQAQGKIIDIGEGISNYGHCWSLTSNPDLSDSFTSLGIRSSTGSFTSNLQSLQPGTKYFIRAYVQSGDKVFYGNELSFTTTSVVLPTLTTTPVSAITQTSATSGGNVTSDGGAAVTERGVCWGTSSGPTISGSHVASGSGIGTFTSNLTGLTPGTTYYVRAYATNSAGNAYGNERTFTTLAGLPVVTTNTVSAITQTSATSGGNVTSDGGAAVTERGVCWGTSSGPTISGSHVASGSGIGTFTSNLTGLTPGTTYYVRAYATNSAGTAYGNERTFTTSPVVVPTLTTTAISTITATTATAGGNITADGGAAVTARGVCWSTSQNPTIANNKTNDGSGTGSFVSNLTGLTANTTYYVRAYATNSAGTGYGNQVSFTTDPLTVTDVDGNNYNVIRIGTQLWMKQNLKTTKYNDGNNIPLVTDNTAWSNLTTPGYCWYNNDAASYKDVYGALYNWYAVNTGKLCPSGWHVPSDNEWTILENYLGGYEVAGGKLKATGTIEAGTGLWHSPNTGATNETGFTAVPGGLRNNDGTFDAIGGIGLWWSSSETSSAAAWGRGILSSYSDVGFYEGLKTNGRSVRCLRD